MKMSIMRTICRKDGKKPSVRPLPPELMREITQVTEQMREVQRRFDMVEDEDLLEALIYERKSLMARHRYLNRLARIQSRSDKEDRACLTPDVSRDLSLFRPL